MSDSIETRFTVQNTKVSQSGKSLGLLIGPDQWLATKDFSLADSTGKTFIGQVSVQKFPDGGSIKWLNNYSEVGATATGTPAHQLTAGLSRDASIVAQALVKAISPGTAEKAWADYQYLYLKAVAWDGKETDIPDPEPVFDDTIPF